MTVDKLELYLAVVRRIITKIYMVYFDFDLLR